MGSSTIVACVASSCHPSMMVFIISSALRLVLSLTFSPVDFDFCLVFPIDG